MPRRAKTLAELAREGTFLARRHASLLVSDPLLAEASLRALQERYRSEPSELERRALARAVERAIQEGRGAPKLTMQQELHATLGPPLWLVHEKRLSYEKFLELDAEWRAWDKKWGKWWLRQQHEGRKPHERCVPDPPGLELVSRTS